MSLSTRQKKDLRARAHRLNPVAIVGQHGLSDAVLAEIERNLCDHELIKVRLRVEERSELHPMVATIVDSTAAELVQVIGRLAVLYRAKPAGLAS